MNDVLRILYNVPTATNPAMTSRFYAEDQRGGSLTGIVGQDRCNASIVMRPSPIISREQSLQILANDLRKVALEKRAVQLKDATPEGRETILAEIERDIRTEMQRRARNGHQNVIF